VLIVDRSDAIVATRNSLRRYLVVLTGNCRLVQFDRRRRFFTEEHVSVS